MEPKRSAAFAPGRVNLIGEHTDYNDGLALPFAIADGVTVTAQQDRDGNVHAFARDLGERDSFAVDSIEVTDGWQGFLRGVVGELARSGRALAGATLEIAGSVPRGAGLSSSAALEVALCLSLAELCEPAPDSDRAALTRVEVAQLCARVENYWVGAHTGLLDQLASLYGAPDRALRIDFRTLQVKPVPLVLGDWRLVVLDSGEPHTHASSGYNERRRECAQACELLGVDSLRHASFEQAAQLPAPLDRRARHVLAENERVQQAVDALANDDLADVARLLNESHQSLRELYDASTPAVERTVERVRKAGAAGARMVGGGFGGSVLALFAPGAQPPADSREVRPGPGAHLLA